MWSDQYNAECVVCRPIFQIVFQGFLMSGSAETKPTFELLRDFCDITTDPTVGTLSRAWGGIAWPTQFCFMQDNTTRIRFKRLPQLQPSAGENQPIGTLCVTMCQCLKISNILYGRTMKRRSHRSFAPQLILAHIQLNNPGLSKVWIAMSEPSNPNSWDFRTDNKISP